METCLHFEAAEHWRGQSQPLDDEGVVLVRKLLVGRGQLPQLDEGASLVLLLGPQIHVLSWLSSQIQSGAATCSEGFVIGFLKVPLALAAWQLQYNPTAWGTLIKHVTKPPEQVAVPDY